MNLQEWEQGGDFLEVDEGKLFYRVAGEGDPLLLLHGFPTSSWDFHAIWPTLAAQYRVITYDKLGFGFSDKPSVGDYTIDAHLRRTWALLTALGITQVQLLAHDVGNTITQAWLARQLEGSVPVRLTRVCLLNGGLFPETHRMRPLQRLLLSPLGAWVARLSSAKRFGQGMAEVFGPNTQPSPQALVDYWTLMSRQQGQHLLHKHIQYIHERRRQRARWVGALQHTPVPLSLIDGVYDPVSGAHMVARFRELLPGRRVTELACGHFPQVEMPEQVLQALTQHWEK